VTGEKKGKRRSNEEGGAAGDRTSSYSVPMSMERKGGGKFYTRHRFKVFLESISLRSQKGGGDGFELEKKEKKEGGYSLRSAPALWNCLSLHRLGEGEHEP